MLLVERCAFSSLRTQNALLKRSQRMDGRRGAGDARFARAAGCALQSSLLAFLVGGSFLSAAYYPYLWFNAAVTEMLAHNAAAVLRGRGKTPRTPTLERRRRNRRSGTPRFPTIEPPRRLRGAPGSDRTS